MPALLRADATIRYQIEFNKAPWLAAATNRPLKTATLGPEKVLHLKGHKSVSDDGERTFIADFDERAYTIIDPAHKAAATVSFADLAKLADALATETMPLLSAPGQPKIESRLTGRTAAIQGVEAEEREVTVSWGAVRGAAPRGGDQSFKFRARLWSATQAGAARVPAIRELTTLKAGERDFSLMLSNAIGESPWVTPILEAFRLSTVALRLQIEIYIPFLTEMTIQELEREGKLAKPVDHGSPFMQIDQIATEISGAPVDPAVFEIPKDYSVLPLEKFREVLKSAPATSATGSAIR